VKRLGERYAEVQDAHQSILREASTGSGGH
jgi:hypothetical protein